MMSPPPKLSLTDSTHDRVRVAKQEGGEISMALIQVARYYSRWDLDNHNGRIAIYDVGNNELDNRVYSDRQEFRLIVDLLRNEKPLWFDTTAKHLRTGFGSTGEPVGEEET